MSLSQAVTQLSRYGIEWSRATLSVAEGGTEGRARQFSASELLAFSRTFGLPIMWFLLPPEDEPVQVTTGAADEDGVSSGDLLMYLALGGVGNEGVRRYRESVERLASVAPSERIQEMLGGSITTFIEQLSGNLAVHSGLLRALEQMEKLKADLEEITPAVREAWLEFTSNVIGDVLHDAQTQASEQNET